MGRQWLGTAALVMALGLYHPMRANETRPDCSGILQDLVPEGSPRRGLAPEDLMGLRDIGPADLPFPDMKLLSVSPDGGRVAFQLRRADAANNGHCLAMVIVALDKRSEPVVVDQGGDLIRMSMDFRASPAFPSGIPMVIMPQWSADGRSIYFLKRTGGFTQVWRADASGLRSEAVTNAPFDVEDFVLDAGADKLIIAGRPRIQREYAAIRREELTGFHFDDRYAPTASKRPFPARPITTEYFAIVLTSGAMTSASADQAQRLITSQAAPGSELAPAISPRNGKAWLKADPESGLIPKLRLTVALESRREIRCAAEACSGRLFRPTWDGDVVYFFRREDPVASVTSLYEWRPGTAFVRRIFSTNDVLIDCQPAGGELLCLREGSTKPRRLERLDHRTGKSRPLYDPNQNFARLTLGRVERLKWRNSFGIETIGDLVYPVGYQAGRQYPLIIVQYDTRGFLRGGIGDEFPIQAFANRGYAVLSFSRPTHFALAGGATGLAEINRGNLTDFADRRSVLSSLEIAINDLAARGIIDRSKVGITGLSDGGSTIEFGLVNSTLFAAAASSSCCWDPTVIARAGPAGARHFVETGYPKISENRPDFWNRISLVANASRIRAPILLQMADDEFMSALPGYTALREHHVPVDLYIFPDEHHVKWQPAHKLAIYKRSLDWFDYWLKDLRSATPERASELGHWDELRAQAASRSPGAPPATSSQ